jgi:hypothetical protein
MNQDDRTTESGADTQPRIRRVFAGAGLFGSVLLFAAAFFLFGFLQIIPGTIVLAASIAVGFSSAATMFAKPPPEDDPQENEPVPNPPPAPKPPKVHSQPGNRPSL